MIAAASGQHNPYQGRPPRPWVRVRLLGPGGDAESFHLIADTGCPCAVIIAGGLLLRMRLAAATSVSSNFGRLSGGWLRVAIPEVHFDGHVVGYGSDPVAASANRSHSEFAGLAGLPLLRMLGFGGDEDTFWIGGDV